MSDVCSITKSTVREVMDEFTRIPLVDGKTFWELDVARDVPSLFEDFACVGRRKVIHYAAFSVGGGLRPLAAGTADPTESVQITRAGKGAFRPRSAFGSRYVKV